MRVLLATFSALAVVAPITMAAAAGSASHGAKRYAAKHHVASSPSAKKVVAKRANARAKPHADHETLRIKRIGDEVVMEQRGKATYYADKFHGRLTATGVRYDQNQLTAASNVMPMGSRVKVTNQRNGRSVHVVINDRGPHAGRGRVIDLSRRAADELGMRKQGVAAVTIEAKPSDQLTRNLRDEMQEIAEAR